MANAQRGEVTAMLDGREWTLCLTLGALAELETHFRVEDLPSLAARLSDGRFSASDITAILFAGLKGGGHDLEKDDVADLRAENGGLGYAVLVADLLVATFGGQAQVSSEPR